MPNERKETSRTPWWKKQVQVIEQLQQQLGQITSDSADEAAAQALAAKMMSMMSDALATCEEGAKALQPLISNYSSVFKPNVCGPKTKLCAQTLLIFLQAVKTDFPMAEESYFIRKGFDLGKDAIINPFVTTIQRTITAYENTAPAVVTQAVAAAPVAEDDDTQDVYYDAVDTLEPAEEEPAQPTAESYWAQIQSAIAAKMADVVKIIVPVPFASGELYDRDSDHDQITRLDPEIIAEEAPPVVAAKNPDPQPHTLETPQAPEPKTTVGNYFWSKIKAVVEKVSDFFKTLTAPSVKKTNEKAKKALVKEWLNETNQQPLEKMYPSLAQETSAPAAEVTVAPAPTSAPQIKHSANRSGLLVGRAAQNPEEVPAPSAAPLIRSR